MDSDQADEAVLPTMAQAEKSAILQALHHFHGNRRKALDHFNAALRLDPDSEDTRANHEFLLQLMREKGMTPKKDFTP